VNKSEIKYPPVIRKIKKYIFFYYELEQQSLYSDLLLAAGPVSDSLQTNVSFTLLRKEYCCSFPVVRWLKPGG
jgi:hypothetical protein